MGSMVATCLASTVMRTHSPNLSRGRRAIAIRTSRRTTYDRDQKDGMFPRITAPPRIVNDTDWVPGEKEWGQEHCGSDFERGVEVRRHAYLRVAPVTPSVQRAVGRVRRAASVNEIA